MAASFCTVAKRQCGLRPVSPAQNAAARMIQPPMPCLRWCWQHFDRMDHADAVVNGGKGRARRFFVPARKNPGLDPGARHHTSRSGPMPPLAQISRMIAKRFPDEKGSHPRDGRPSEASMGSRYITTGSMTVYPRALKRLSSVVLPVADHEKRGLPMSRMAVSAASIVRVLSLRQRGR